MPDDPADALPPIRFRRPTEADYVPIVRLIDDWWGGRSMTDLLQRVWLQHFTGTSWLAETDDGRIAGFLIGFMSPDHPDTAYCKMIGTNPNLRGRGLGAELYARFFADAKAAGRTRVVAITWPGNKVSLAFHLALGFRLETGPGTQNLYGTPSYPAYDVDREDRAVLVRSLKEAG